MGVPSLLPTADKEVQILPIPPPRKIRPPGTDSGETEENLNGLMVEERGTILAGRERKPRMEVEAALADIRQGEELLLGWEWFWREDPWTGKVEKLRILKKEADTRRRRRESTPKSSYWGEKETKEWRRLSLIHI